MYVTLQLELPIYLKQFLVAILGLGHIPCWALWLLHFGRHKGSYLYAYSKTIFLNPRLSLVSSLM